MGFFEAQRAKLDARIALIARETLAEGEEVRAAVLGVKQGSLWILVLPLLVLTTALAYWGYEVRSWLIGAIVGSFVAVTLKSYCVLVSSERLVLVRFSSLSTKRFSTDRDIPFSSITEVEYRHGLVNDLLRIETRTGDDERLKVSRRWREDGKKVAGLLPRGHHAGTESGV